MSVRQITVAGDDEGQRLERWLKKQMPGVPYALLQKMLRTGQVRVNGKRAKADLRLAAGQIVRVPPFDPKAGDKRGNKFERAADDKAFLESLILYDDGEIIAINKPFGLAVQGGSGITRHVDGMLESLENRKGVRPRLTHRLDRDTSGILILARSLKATQAMGRIFAGRRIRKYYWGITVPAPEMEAGRIDMPLNKGVGMMKDMVLVDEENGKKAVTEFSVMERAAKKAAFVAFWPRTGRTHQIRVHAAKGLECPLLGDEKYGPRDDGFGGLDVSPRLHLHARRIIFPHPLNDQMIDILATLPSDLRKTWNVFGFNADDRTDPFSDIEI